MCMGLFDKHLLHFLKKSMSKLHCCEARRLIIIIVTVITILVCNMPSTLPWEIILYLNIYFASSLSANSTKITHCHRPTSYDTLLSLRYFFQLRSKNKSQEPLFPEFNG